SEGGGVVALDVQTTSEWEDFATGSATASLHHADVRDEDAVAACYDSVTVSNGRIDIVVNSAGVAGGGPVHLVAASDWQRTIDINLTGTFLSCKHALRYMVPQRSGSIVNVASIEGIQGTEGGSSYN